MFIKILIIIMGLILNNDAKEIYLSLSEQVRREIDKQMASLNVQVDSIIDNLVNDIIDYGEGRTGLTQREIVNQIEDLQKQNGGMFQDVVNKFKKSVGVKTFEISEDIFFGKLKTEADYYRENQNETMMWTAMFVNTCPSCLNMHGTIKSRARWEGNAPNERFTLCTIRGRCHCVLIPTGVLPSKNQMMKPLKIQAERIRKAEKKRGKRYAKSTRTGLMGTINNPKGRVRDLRKIKKV